MSPAELVTPGLIREFASVDVSEDNARYRAPLERDVATLALRLPGRARVVLLGSVASGKYVDVLWPMLGKRLCYPTSFIGRGDMSRGGLLLRCVASGEELGTLARRRSLSAPLRGVADDGRTLGGTVARHARASCDCSSRRRRGPGRHRRRCRAWWWRRRTRLVRFERAFRNRRNAEASGAYCESGENRVYSGSFVS